MSLPSIEVVPLHPDELTRHLLCKISRAAYALRVALRLDTDERHIQRVTLRRRIAPRFLFAPPQIDTKHPAAGYRANDAANAPGSCAFLYTA